MRGNLIVVADRFERVLDLLVDHAIDVAEIDVDVDLGGLGAFGGVGEARWAATAERAERAVRAARR